MKIVIFNWRDLEHPKAGGAEVVTHVLASGLAERGHRVLWFTSRRPGEPEHSKRVGYTVERRGSELTCRFHAFAWLRARRDAFDVVIDEVNTLPFLSRFATSRPVVLWLHQLAREVWLAEAPPLIGRIGYLLEPAMLAVYRGLPIVTVSKSSAASFPEAGLSAEAHVVGEPLAQADASPCTPRTGRIVYVGRITPSKRIDHLLRAFSLVRARVPDAELIVAGDSSARELQRLRRLAASLKTAQSVTFTGRVSNERRDDLLRSADVLAMTSLREGWGLVVSEAARFRVPSVVYPVAGLVDSVQDGVTGLVATAQTPHALAAQLLRVIEDRALRDRLGAAAAEHLRGFPESRFIDEFEAFLLAAVRA